MTKEIIYWSPILEWFMQDEYGIKDRNFKTPNPQFNSILDRVHQTIENVLIPFGLTIYRIVWPCVNSLLR